MAARDYPPENPGEFQPTPGKARPREHGVAAGDGVSLGQKVLGWSRWLLTALTVVYCVLYLVVLYGMEHEAENSQFFSVAMYAPPWVWLLPIIPLGALAIFIYARLLIPLALCVPVMIFGFMDLRWNSHVSATGRAFKVVTNNIGQDHKKSYTSFADLQKADIIALQDANPTVHGKQAATRCLVRAGGGRPSPAGLHAAHAHAAPGNHGGEKPERNLGHAGQEHR